MDRIRRIAAAEQGIALVMALGVLLAFTVTGTSLAYYTTSNGNSTAHVRSDQVARALAEGGLAMAWSRLENASNPSMLDALPPQTAPAVVPEDGGTASYYGTLDSTTKIWTLTGVGTVTMQGTGAQIVRAVHSRAQLGSGTRGNANNAVWNYVYADALTGCTRLDNQVTISVPFYIRGNLCMYNSASVTSYAVQVGGKVTMNSSSNAIGDSAAPLHEIHIAGGCSPDGGAHYDGPCGPVDRVYGLQVDAKTTGFTKPPVDMPGTYASAQPGPKHGCTTGSFPGGFDNDGVMNASLRSIDIAPKGVAYDCRVLDASGAVVAEIGWDGASSLTIQGTIFFDGNIVMNTQNHVVYHGKATIYASGTISISNQSTICGTDINCNTNWDNTKDMLAWVSGAACPGNGSELDGFKIDNYSTFQGAIYTVCDYGEGNHTTVWGPVVSRQLYFQNSTTNFYVPIGVPLPGMPAQYDQVVTVAPVPGSWGD
ncbi:MAG: hypothetical protein E6G08_11655 [Actinobacteria bacterium]|nr:MAG: hypothetical protein E6G08_11655 [Actinomycetota bacterium]